MKLGSKFENRGYKTAERCVEKHVPFVEKTPFGYRVTVGECALHPMTEEHFVDEILLFVDGICVGHKVLRASGIPIAEFNAKHGKHVIAVESCNIHGDWMGELTEE